MRKIQSLLLGSEMFGAIYAAFGKAGALSVMQNPQQLFKIYNDAIDAKPDLLKRCIRTPERTVRQALSIGQ